MRRAWAKWGLCGRGRSNKFANSRKWEGEKQQAANKKFHRQQNYVASNAARRLRENRLQLYPSGAI